MPFSAPTAPPWAPVLGMAEDDGDAAALVPPGGMAGTVVVAAPILISMWAAVTAGLAVGVAPKGPASRAALGASPAPYAPWGGGSGVVFPTRPAWYPAWTTAEETWLARPAVWPPLSTSTTVLAAAVPGAGVLGLADGALGAGEKADWA